MRGVLRSSVLLSALAAWGAGAAAQTVGPIVGIFSQPSSNNITACGGSCEYLAASYVKWVESAGGRVIPIPYNASTGYLDKLFEGLNAVLIPGGGNSLSEAAQYMLRKAVAANDAGDFFPFWGTCMGFQWMTVAVAGDGFQLDGVFDAENISLPLDFTDAAAKSRMWGSAPTDIVKIAGSLPVTLNNHHYGVTPEHFTSTKALDEMFVVLSTNQDRAGMAFVSSVEGRKYPFYGLQWHPEKNVYEWGEVEGLPYEAINHSPEAQALTNYMSHFFLSEARKSSHRFADADFEAQALIYNYSPVYSGPEFIQSYFFHW